MYGTYKSTSITDSHARSHSACNKDNAACDIIVSISDLFILMELVYGNRKYRLIIMLAHNVVMAFYIKVKHV